jgi:hypothetical protein
MEGERAMQFHWRFPLTLFALVFPLSFFSGIAQSPNTFNEREVRTPVSSLDKADVWAFDFRFKDPRLIKVQIPGRGTRICWYLWYQVINRTKEPQWFVPDFELVTTDRPGVYLDEILPTAEEAIKRIEDPTGYQEIRNSVTIRKEKIPVSKPEGEAFPRVITGVAIWDASPADLKNREGKERDLSDATRFSIFVRGLSNGYVIVEPLAPGLAPVTRYKTLQLNFQRRGDRFSTDSRDITFVPPFEWIYRAARQKEKE